MEEDGDVGGVVVALAGGDAESTSGFVDGVVYDFSNAGGSYVGTEVHEGELAHVGDVVVDINVSGCVCHAFEHRQLVVMLDCWCCFECVSSFEGTCLAWSGLRMLRR